MEYPGAKRTGYLGQTPINSKVSGKIRALLSPELVKNQATPDC
jgi:hypothetical protein